MGCMKCGRELEEGQVFCTDCLEQMAAYPVKPGTAVFLPHHRSSSPVKKILPKRRQAPTMEEMVIRLKKRSRRLFLLWLITLALLAWFAYPVIRDLVGSEKLLPGQNYTPLITTTTETN